MYRRTLLHTGLSAVIGLTVCCAWAQLAFSAETLGLQVLSAFPPAADQASLLDLPRGDRPVTVRVAFHLLDINEIDEEAETFEFSGVLTLKWIDERQAFDPAAAGVNEKIYQGD